jgi:nitroimidazol reductase NimA-like FMN-containing flavoprotein (pyridoxamine 5'-phosphate oxidase superfamily)
MTPVQPTPRTTLRRLPARGEFSREAIDAILDEAFLCHVGFLDEEGRPAVIPTAFGREGDSLYLHGSNKNRALQAMIGRDCCLTVTLLDGFVLARSTFHHSFNYRSVVVYGKGQEVTDAEEKLRAVNCITDHIVPGRTGEARTPNEKELRATLVVRLSLQECSAKVRTGGPKDDAEDMSVPVWAGVLPVSTAYGAPEPASDLDTSVEASPVVSNYRRPARPWA